MMHGTTYIKMLAIGRRGCRGDLNGNTLTAVTDASSPVRKSVACVSYVSEGVKVSVLL